MVLVLMASRVAVELSFTMGLLHLGHSERLSSSLGSHLPNTLPRAQEPSTCL